MVTFDAADRDRLGGPTFAWIGKHGERLRPRHGARRVRQALGRLGQLDRDRLRSRMAIATRMTAAAPPRF